MRTKRVGWAVAAVLGVLGAAVPAAGFDSFRAVGWFKGKSQISDGAVRCEIPTTTSGISDGTFSMGLWSTFGESFLAFPDANSAFANPCGGFLHLQNNLLAQGITVERVALTFRVLGAKRFRQFVPTRNGLPVACRPFRKQTLFTGAYLGPANSTTETPSGAPNSVLIQLLPMVSSNLVGCLRSQYGPVPTDVLSSITLKILATAVGTSDAGDEFRSNTLGYALSLRHTCGNGRVDDGEICDPAATNTCTGFCAIASGETTGICSGNDLVLCRSDVDCFGTCLGGNSPEECTCLY
jgi:hypothetical protein